MTPNASKHYPIIKGFSHFSPPPSATNDLDLQLDKFSSLAYLAKIPRDDYLKKTMHDLKNPFSKFPDVAVCIVVALSVHSAQGTHNVTLKWSTVITKMDMQHQMNVLQALTILNHGLFLSNALLRSVTQLGSDTKIGDAEIEKLKRLKEHLLMLTSVLDKILMCYSNTCTRKVLPSLDEVKRLSKKLFKIINSLNPSRLPQLIHDTCMLREEDILCSVLGLQESIACSLADLNSAVRTHQTDLYFIQRFLEEGFEFCDDGESLMDREVVASKLQQMGFTENRSVVVAAWIAEQPLAQHQSLLAWAQHYIESLFNYDIFLNDCVRKYPYQDINMDKWFTVPVEREREDDMEKFDVEVINTILEVGSMQGRVKELLHRQHSERRFYFHGTDHKGAKSILEDGINLGAGKRSCDFSDGYGFYLSESSDFALDWALQNEACAVIVFAISEYDLNSFRCLDLSSQEKAADRKIVKKHYRFGAKLPKLLNQECKNCDYIAGPISRDGSVESPQQDFQVICIKKESMAQVIGSARNIFGVVFANVLDLS